MPATQVEHLSEMVGKEFVSERYGNKTVVKLEEVRKDKVVVSQEGRVDKQFLQVERFCKFYKPTH